MPKGAGEMIATLSYYASDGGRDEHGNPVASGRYRRIEFSPYIEYGLLARTTIVFQPRFEWAQAGLGADEESHHSLGDIDLFVRRELFSTAGWIGSAQAGLIFAGAYDAADRPPPGTGQQAYEARLELARNFGARGAHYIDIESAYRIGEGGVADQIRGEATLGLRPGRRWLMIEELSTERSLGSGDGASGHWYDLDKGETALVYFVRPRIGVELGYTRDLDGRNVGLGASEEIALWTRF